MYKKFPIILTFLIISGGILWLSIKPSVSFFGSRNNDEVIETQDQEVVESKPEEKDEISILFEALQKQLDVSPGEIYDDNFDWIVSQEEIDSVLEPEKLLISGKSLKLEDLSLEQQNKIGKFFEDSGFEADALNVSAGTIGSITGYRKNDLVCLYVNSVGEGEDPVYTATISCGFSQELERKPLVEDELSSPDEDKLALVKLFSEKYDKPEGDVNLTISENDGTYAKGGINFSGELSGAMWLAYKGESGWKLIFDGNGTVPCSSVEPYDFPLEMVSECWDESSQKLIKL